MMRRPLPSAVLVLVVAAAAVPAFPAAAAPVALTVRGADGQPVTGAVVMVDSAARRPNAPIRFPWPYVVAQQNISFQPHVLIVPVGATVTFPNRDRVRHHVYSFSAPKKFELKLYGREEARSITFDKAGLVALGCNIHDSMSGFVMVVDTPYAAQTDATGHATIDVPEGAATLRIWHVSVRAPGNQLRQPLAVPAGGIARAITIARP